jgi:ankyrin repeat protein
LNSFFSFSNFFFQNTKMSVPSTKVKGQELRKAAENGTTDEILRLWRENGATLDVEHRDGFGSTPLHCAAYYGHGEACRALISTCRARIDSRDLFGNTPLILAAANNKLQCVEVLMELGADITLRNDEGKTALEWAREKGHAEVAALLEAAERIPEIKSALKV